MWCNLCKQEVKELTWDKHIHSESHQKAIDEAIKKEDGEEKHGFVLTDKGITRF